MLDQGTPAPAFKLPATGGKTLVSSKLRGKIVVLYFYPKDDTTGCTTEAKDFTARADQFAAAGAVVIGVSPDGVAAHEKFAGKHGLTIELAADEDKTVAEAYGVWVEKSMYGRKYMGVERTTLLIDGKGVVREIWPKVKVAGHARAVLDAVKALK